MSTAISTSLAPTLPGARTFGRGGEVDRAILRTVLYAALFQAPLTVSQLHARSWTVLSPRRLKLHPVDSCPGPARRVSRKSWSERKRMSEAFRTAAGEDRARWPGWCCSYCAAPLQEDAHA